MTRTVRSVPATKPEEVVALAVYVTGATFVVDGGMMRQAGIL